MKGRLAGVLLSGLVATAGCISARAAQPGVATRMTSVILVRRLYKPPGPTGWPVHSYYGRTIRAKYTLWYEDGTHWRVGGHYIVTPHDAFLLRNGSYGAPFYPFPGIVVQRGHTIWHYDARHRDLKHVRVASDGMDPMADQYNQVGLFLDRFHPRSIDDLVRSESKCHRVSLEGTKPIAGREADVLRLGPDRCNMHSASASDTAGPAVAWVDRAKFVLLRYDLYLPGGQTLLYRVMVTQVRYGARISPALLLPP
jgi:outer membrane lipoprotein-sorting protein